MGENLSQTRYKVPGTVDSVDLVSFLQAVNTECLVYSSCVHIIYILSSYVPEFSRLTSCLAINVRAEFPYRYW